MWRVALLVWLGAAHPPSLTMQTWPAAFALAPCSVTIQIRAIPLVTDREIHVTAEGLLCYRASAWSIESSTAPRTYRVVWRDLPAGTYQVVAPIGPPGRVRARATSTLELL